MKVFRKVVVAIFTIALLIATDLADFEPWFETPEAAAQSNTSTGPQNQAVSTQGLYGAGGAQFFGSVRIKPIGTPAAPTAVVNGTAGATSYVYFCVAQDMNAAAAAVGGLWPGETIPSASLTVTTGNATLSATNSITVTCGGGANSQAGALGYRVLKVDTSHQIGTCTANSFVNGGTQTGTGCSVTDIGTASTAYTPNTVDQTGSIGAAGTGGVGLQENSLGTGINTLTCQAQTAFTVTGVTTAMGCECNLGVALPATWQTGIVLSCATTANTVTPWLCNPTATATITPAAALVDCRVIP